MSGAYCPVSVQPKSFLQLVHSPTHLEFLLLFNSLAACELNPPPPGVVCYLLLCFLLSHLDYICIEKWDINVPSMLSRYPQSPTGRPQQEEQQPCQGWVKGRMRLPILLFVSSSQNGPNGGCSDRKRSEDLGGGEPFRGPFIDGSSIGGRTLCGCVSSTALE